ncbi:DUF4167 domain-containing protein [Brevundimonas sp.]|uniref:DUF4167 domain-containing protein n=1 Tax=Brevundimonas sp. TaxID=1871086 RepID=UPI002ED83CA1
MRDFKGMKRQRGRNRKPGGGGGGNANATNPNRSWDSQGPENIKVRGNAQTVYERYMQLARDASAGGDRVLAENYTQHAEHYFRVLRALQPSRPVSEIAQRELAGQGFDIDFEDETGAQAAAIMAAEKAEADRVAAAEARQREQDERQNDRSYDRPNDRQAEQPRREWRDRDDQPREPRAEGDGPIGEGGRRETRRERWERRQQERNQRFQNERGEGEQGVASGDGGESATAPESRDAEPAPARAERPQRERRPRRDEAAAVSDEAPTALPGFLTRPAAPAAAGPAPEDRTEGGEADAPAPKRRAPRRKAEASAGEG